MQTRGPGLPRLGRNDAARDWLCNSRKLVSILRYNVLLNVSASYSDLTTIQHIGNGWAQQRVSGDGDFHHGGHLHLGVRSADRAGEASGHSCRKWLTGWPIDILLTTLPKIEPPLPLCR